ncbi:TNF receptor-associated factor 1-like [Protopterus annectens]|uniref:TNF receptor-associated factor 1-like n=1 Tax=Protopterus annectens TaxID=7888 RepID=UPI001CFB0EA8|nr:TNF receptor-associated factor 1-like [Protopterus annectens]
MSLLYVSEGEVHHQFSLSTYKAQTTHIKNTEDNEKEEEAYVGYGVESFSSYEQKYCCGICGRLLWEPVQNIPCGHRFCLHCYKTLISKGNAECPDCQKEHKMNSYIQVSSLQQCFRDNAIKKELLNLPAECPFSNCTWRGNLRNLKEHKKNCQWEMIECPFKIIGCEEKFLRKDSSQHETQSLSVHLLCVLALIVKKKDILDNLPFQKTEESKPDTISSNPQEKISCPLDSEVKCKQTFSSTEMEAMLKRTVQLEEKQQVFQNVLTVLNREMGKMEKLSDYERQLSEAKQRIEFLEHQVNQHQLNSAYKDRVLAAMTNRLCMLEQTSFDGTYIWKITCVSEKMDSAMTGKNLCVYSPPFYTGKYGYKVCMKLFLNGDGAGLGTHMSIFLVIMKGEYDFKLKWPFPYKVTFTLLDQLSQRDISASFKPTDGSSFQRPLQEKNIASGLPEFITLDELYSSDCAYIKDNLMYIKAETGPTV